MVSEANSKRTFSSSPSPETLFLQKEESFHIEFIMFDRSDISEKKRWLKIVMKKDNNNDYDKDDE